MTTSKGMTPLEFRQKMSQLPEPATSLKPPNWEYWRWELWHLGQRQDVSKFWEFPCVYHCMLVQHWLNPILYERSQLSLSRFEHTSIFPALELSERSFESNFLKTPLTNNLIHQAYHIQQWEQTTGKRVEDLKSIVEFGGGYGAMRLLCHELGFRGKYIIFDLPEFALLQEYYLSQFKGIETTWNPRRHRQRNVDLFIALYSISEVEPMERKQYIPMADSFLFLYSGKWQEYDNVGWFRHFANETVLEWEHREIQHLPDRNNWYSIGF